MRMTWPRLLNSQRRRKSTGKSDHREEFERDYDRTVFSTPVKRLQDKAQVFPLDPHDSVRTRLTHSLEVSSVAKGIGTKVARWLGEEQRDGFCSGMDRQVEAIAATCGLLHDLGNPPFGHAGEAAIQEWFKHRFEDKDLRLMLGCQEQLMQDFLKFEGNAQTIRLVAKLQILADEYGLNLTFGTLSAACKYVSSSDRCGSDQNRASKKPGYFASENGLIKSIREATGTGDARNPITYLVEAADDIVYSVADIEDAIKKGVLAWEEVEAALRGEENGSISSALVNSVMDAKNHILRAGREKVPDGLPRTSMLQRSAQRQSEFRCERYPKFFNKSMTT